MSPSALAKLPSARGHGLNQNIQDPSPSSWLTQEVPSLRASWITTPGIFPVYILLCLYCFLIFQLSFHQTITVATEVEN